MIHGSRGLAVLVVIAVALGAAPSALAASTGQISGTVTRASGGAAIQEIEVCAFSTSAEEFSAESFGCATTSSSGEYTITGLASGQYDVEFMSPSESEPGYITQYYDGTTSFEDAKAVPVTAGGTALGIDAALEEGGRITGDVTRASGGAPIEGIAVCASAVHGEGFGCAKTKSNGTYTITGLAGGNYDVEFFPSFESGLDFIAQYYNDRSSSKEAEAVPVTAPMTTSNIDAAMQSTSTPPANTTAPVLSGTPIIGSTLLCAPGLWTGKPVPAFSYQWLRSGAPIAGANASSYTVQNADAGGSISCEVTAKNGKGEANARSAGVAIPANPVISPPPPAPKPLITITGSKVLVSGGSATVHIICSDAACAGSGELTVQIVVKHRKGKKTVSRKQTLVLAKGSYSLAAGQGGTLVLRLTAAGRQRLAHVKHDPLAVKLTLSVQGSKTIAKSVTAS
jgi:hypothetical protein